MGLSEIAKPGRSVCLLVGVLELDETDGLEFGVGCGDGVGWGFETLRVGGCWAGRAGRFGFDPGPGLATVCRIVS